MNAIEWLDCDLLEIVPGKVSGAAVFKNTRLPVEAVTGNVDAFLAEGLTLERAIAETLDCYPDTSGGASGIQAVLNYRSAWLDQKHQ